MQFNRHFINRIEKKDVLRLLLALVAVFVIGVLGEFVCNFPALRQWMDAAGDADDRSGRGAGERI